MKEKRSILSPTREKEIRKADVYRITCRILGCTCDETETSCQRGFFSLFIQAINGLHFAERHGLQPWVDFGDGPYCYTSPSRENNFWDYYFVQPTPSADQKIITNKFVEVHPIRIWHRSYFREMNRIVQRLIFQPEVRKILKEKARHVQQQSTLGIQIRGTDHPGEIEPPAPDRYVSAIQKYLPQYDKLFVATDDKKYLELMQHHFGDKLINHDVIRSDGTMGVHRDPARSDGYRLGLDVLADCYCLSQCDRVILVSSNVSFASLLFNPEISFSIIEESSARWKRLKTSIVYLLDHWGIRKW